MLFGVEYFGYGLAKLKAVLSSKRIYLRTIELDDLNTNYLNWLNCEEVNSYLETRFQPQSSQSIREYWERLNKDQNSHWLGICLHESQQHIGNIKLGPINWIHRRADISLFIGEKKCWGLGYATESIKLIKDWSFANLGLEKLTAGMYECNKASTRAFEKNGFEIEGILKDEAYFKGNRVNIIRMGLSKLKDRQTL